MSSASSSRGWTALAGAVIAVSSSALFVRAAQEGASSLAVAAWRTVIAAALVAAWTVPRRRQEIASLTAGDAAAAVVAGVCLAVHFASWIGSLEWTSVAVSVSLVNTAPLFVATLGPLATGERPSRAAAVGAIVATAGATAIGLNAESAAGRDDLRGAALAVAGAVSVAAYLVAGRRVRDRMPLDLYVTLVYGTAAVCLMGAALLTGQTLSGFGPRPWAAIVGLAVVCQIVGHTATNYAVRAMPASVVATALLAEPLLATAAAYAALGERVGGGQLAGAALVVAGIATAARGGRPPVAEPTPGGESA